MIDHDSVFTPMLVYGNAKSRTMTLTCLSRLMPRISAAIGRTSAKRLLKFQDLTRLRKLGGT